MAQLVNPSYKIIVYGTTELEIKDLYVEFEANKDLEDEPNEAEITLYNLEEGNRGALLDAGNSSAPIELYVTESGNTDLVMCFKGEIDTVLNHNTRPGWETELFCTSQQINHRSKFIDKKEYKKGTPESQIVDYFIEVIGLPRGQVDSLPTAGTLLSQSFSGPAFPLLKSFVFDYGLYCYILDGKINITDIYDPTNPTIKQIPTNRLLSEPIQTRRMDRSLIQMETVAETVKRIKNEPFRKKKRKKNRRKKEVSRSDYVIRSATDTLVEGMDFQFLMQPEIQPDDLINVPTAGFEKQLWRVKEVEHVGDTETFNDWSTLVSADKFEDVEGTYENAIPAIAPGDAVTILNISKKTRLR